MSRDSPCKHGSGRATPWSSISLCSSFLIFVQLSGLSRLSPNPKPMNSRSCGFPRCSLQTALRQKNAAALGGLVPYVCRSVPKGPPSRESVRHFFEGVPHCAETIGFRLAPHRLLCGLCVFEGVMQKNIYKRSLQPSQLLNTCF